MRRVAATASSTHVGASWIAGHAGRPALVRTGAPTITLRGTAASDWPVASPTTRPVMARANHVVPDTSAPRADPLAVAKTWPDRSAKRMSE